ncbi:amidohydrolase family protein [Ningiella sp. W23]|uniref:amidohydrolase family protein n=1 Tax=Ningiella sp. W23 TaxID=3023715 RepID=UPI003756A63A
MIDVIDPHVHLFDLAKGQYHWLNSLDARKRQCVAKSATFESLSLPSFMRLSAFVHIEAGYDNAHPVNEMAMLTERNTLHHKAIGFADLSASEEAFRRSVDTQMRHPNFAGIRDIISNICHHTDNTCEQQRALKLLDSPVINANLDYLSSKKHAIAYIFELQFDCSNASLTDKVIQVFERHPKLKIVLNHAGFAPLGQPQAFARWDSSLQKLSALTNMHVKCSGWEMSKDDYQFSELREALKVLTQHFDSKRLMLASNFPLTEFAYSYTEYWQGLFDACRALGLSFETLAHDNAKRFYFTTT